MNKTSSDTIAEMNAKVAQLSSQLEQINTTLQHSISAGPIAAQSKRLVAKALANDANHTLQQIAESTELLKPQQKSEGNAAMPASKTGLLAYLGEMVDAILETIAQAAAEQFGIEPAAIEPFLIEHNSVMLEIVADMLDRASVKLTEAAVIEEQEVSTKETV